MIYLNFTGVVAKHSPINVLNRVCPSLFALYSRVNHWDDGTHCGVLHQYSRYYKKVESPILTICDLFTVILKLLQVSLLLSSKVPILTYQEHSIFTGLPAPIIVQLKDRSFLLFLMITTYLWPSSRNYTRLRIKYQKSPKATISESSRNNRNTHERRHKSPT